MKSQVYDKSANAKGSIELPNNFSDRIRPDITQKVVECQKFHQPMGIGLMAGMKYSAEGTIRHKRHSWKSGYGKGIARTPRKIMSRHGASFNWVGASVVNARGGRRAHPPRTQENQFRKVNKRELLIAMNSGFSASVNREFLEKKYGEKVNVPVVFSSDVLSIKTKDFIQTIEKLFNNLKVLKEKRIRPGRGKTRGRRFKSNVGLLFVVGNDEEMQRKGIEVMKVSELAAKDLSPNGVPGRLVCYTEKAIKQISEKFK